MKSKHMTMAQITAVLGWLAPRKDTLKDHTRREVARMIQSEMGIKGNEVRLAEMEEAVGVKRQRGNMGGHRKDRGVVLAQELIRVQKELGMDISDDLQDIADRK